MTDHENDPTIDVYNNRVADLQGKYELFPFEKLHADIIDLLPISETAAVLDIGAGSGRDAAWFAGKGCDVVAVEPSQAMLAGARLLHTSERIRWISDRLPGLEKTMRLGLQFDLIWLSAVWMHIPPADRSRAFRKLSALLKPAGWIMLSLRHGDFEDGRKAYPVSTYELDKLAQQHGLIVRRVCGSEDRFKREGVSWQWVCLQLPDDGTEALPLLRHTILRDNKSSTYKLALLRVLVRIADSAVGSAREHDDETVALPFGLVALYWIRMFKPLIEAGIPQMPSSLKDTGPGFVKEAFWNLKEYAPYDLSIGKRFSGGNAASLLEALKLARNTIAKMPAHYIKHPNRDEQVFKTILQSSRARSDSFVLDSDFLWGFGEFLVPRRIWFAMSRYAAWIEPALLSEWIQMMQDYGARQGMTLSFDELSKHLRWIDPERDTALVRQLADRMREAGQPVYCIWSGKILQAGNSDIDHCIPFAAWPCADLWNLMPALRSINQYQKKDKLVSAATLERSAERIHDWWQRAYLLSSKVDMSLAERFLSEASSSLPLVDSFYPASYRENSELSARAATARAAIERAAIERAATAKNKAAKSVESKNTESNSAEAIDMILKAPELTSHIMEGLMLKRAAIKRDLQLPDWDYSETKS